MENSNEETPVCELCKFDMEKDENGEWHCVWHLCPYSGMDGELREDD